MVDEVADLEPFNEVLEDAYESYYEDVQKEFTTIPDLKGMSGMDAVSILENLGLQVEVKGNGKVMKQSVSQGTRLNEVTKIVLDLS